MAKVAKIRMITITTMTSIRVKPLEAVRSPRSEGRTATFDPENPRQLTGFEVELAELLAAELGVKARFQQGQWDRLPLLLSLRPQPKSGQ